MDLIFFNVKGDYLAQQLPPGVYSLFEERFRGSPEEVADKQKFYLPFLDGIDGRRPGLRGRRERRHSRRPGIVGATRTRRQRERTRHQRPRGAPASRPAHASTVIRNGSDITRRARSLTEP